MIKLTQVWNSTVGPDNDWTLTTDEHWINPSFIEELSTVDWSPIPAGGDTPAFPPVTVTCVHSPTAFANIYVEQTPAQVADLIYQWETRIRSNRPPATP